MVCTGFHEVVVKLLRPSALEHVWEEFLYDDMAQKVTGLKGFQTFEDMVSAINHVTGVSEELATMILEHINPDQTSAVGNEYYKEIIQNDLGIPCLCCATVGELMWGLRFQMQCLVPEEKSELTEDLFPMCEAIKILLNRHSFEVKPDMMVIKRIIKAASVLYDFDRCVNKHSKMSGEYLKEISRFDSKEWDLMKLALALKMICCPQEKFAAAQGLSFQLFSRQELKWLRDYAPKYKNKIKTPCLAVYDKMCRTRELKAEAARMLIRLINKAYDAEQAPEAAVDHEICPAGKKIV
uniref:Uncharacterized protein n=1 Tax=Leersia perrieri TaxID=77586 RepID=A0A0D9XIN9_9ORYZ